MKRTVQDIINDLVKECKDNGYTFLVQIDDGKHITGQYEVVTGSKLHTMTKAVNKLTDTYSETTD